jgi:hypothetical protein
MPIYLFGTEDQRREWLPELASGCRLAAFGLTEPGADSDTGAARTRAELRDGSWIVNGSKIFITHAGTDITACVTITARAGEDEISNIVVPNGTPGYGISAPMHKLGWRASDTRELSFHDCAVPAGNLLGKRARGYQQFLEILDGGRILVAAMGVGLARARTTSRRPTRPDASATPSGRRAPAPLRSPWPCPRGNWTAWNFAIGCPNCRRSWGGPSAARRRSRSCTPARCPTAPLTARSRSTAAMGFMDEFPIARL